MVTLVLTDAFAAQTASQVTLDDVAPLVDRRRLGGGGPSGVMVFRQPRPELEPTVEDDYVEPESPPEPEEVIEAALVADVFDPEWPDTSDPLRLQETMARRLAKPLDLQAPSFSMDGFRSTGLTSTPRSKPALSRDDFLRRQARRRARRR